jgi:putative addiction module killer protein
LCLRPDDASCFAYFTIRKRVVVVLLCGGDKRKQQADIKLARKMAQEV